jgi:hypothetical protein
MKHRGLLAQVQETELVLLPRGHVGNRPAPNCCPSGGSQMRPKAGCAARWLCR